MQHWEVSRELDAASGEAWEILTDVRHWPAWGPSVRVATLDDGGHTIFAHATGRVTTAVGVGLPFRITELDPGRSWRWDVAGVGATDHRVDPLDDERCRVTFGVPWIAAPYLAVCRIALGRIADLLDA